MPGFIGPGKFQAFDDNGDPLVGGQLWVLEANSGGFSSLVDSYNDFQNAIDEVSPQTNPVILDSRGEAIVIINQSVKLVLEEAPLGAEVHGTEVWSLEEVAVADAQNISVGGYQFLNNTIADADDNIVCVLATETAATSYLKLQAHDANDPPELVAVNSGVTNLDLVVSPQSDGTVVAVNRLRVRESNSANSNNLVFTSTASAGTPTITTDGTDSNISCTFTCKGTGTLTIGSPTSINGNTSIVGTLTNTGNVSVTGDLTTSGSVTTTNPVLNGTTTATTINAGATAVTTLTSSGFVQGTSLKISNSGFIYTLNSPTLSANKTYTLPNADGTNGQVLKTNGSGTWSFGDSTTKTPFATAGATGGQTVTAGATDKVTLTVTGSNPLTIDPLGFLDNANDRLIPTTAGYYRLSFNASLTCTSVGDSCILKIYKNGSIYNNVAFNWFDSTATAQFATGEVIVSANGSSDYFELFLQAFTSTITIGSGTLFTCQLVYAT